MIKNFLLILKRFKTSSFINIVGLSAALIVFFVVLLQVYYDFTFNRSYKNADRMDIDRLGQKRRIQAIAKNVNFESLHDSIRPMAFGVLAKNKNFQYILVKLNGTEIPNSCWAD